MAITTQLYIPDRGSVTINLSEVNGSVKTLSYNVPRKSERIVNSLGGIKTETQDRAKAGNFEVSMTILDDRSLSEDLTTLMAILWIAYETNIELTDMIVVPAGSTTGMTGYTFGGSIHVVSCPPHGDMDADTEEEAVAPVIIVTETITPAAIL